MIRFIFILSFAIIVLSCKKEDRPETILSPEQMVEGLIGMYIAEAKINRIPGNRDSLLRAFDHFEGRIFENIGVSDSVFRASYNYYLDRPNQLDEIYAVLIDSLNLREQRMGEPKMIE